MAETIRLGVTVDTDTRATRKEFADLRREVKREAEGMGDDWEAAASKIEDSLREAGARDDLIEAARRIGQDGPTEIEKMQRALRDLGDTADDTADKTRTAGDDMSDAFDGATDSARTAGDTMSESFEGPLTKSQDLANEIRSSLGESMGEVASSFAENGFNMEDTLDGVLEVASEVAAGLPGPFGAAASTLVTIAAGVWGEWNKRMQEVSENASAMYADMVESGNDFLSDAYFQGKLQEFFDPMGESYESNMDKIDLLADLGVPTDEAARALVGYGDVSDEVFEKLKDGAFRTGEGFDNLLAGPIDALGLGSADVMAGILDDLADNKKAVDRAKTATEAYGESVEDLPENKKTEVDVTDDGSVKDTQKKIDDVRGSDATIRVTADVSAVYNQIGNVLSYIGNQFASVNVGARGSFYG